MKNLPAAGYLDKGGCGCMGLRALFPGSPQISFSRAITRRPGVIADSLTIFDLQNFYPGHARASSNVDELALRAGRAPSAGRNSIFVVEILEKKA